jgi:hypothetical protein
MYDRLEMLLSSTLTGPLPETSGVTSAVTHLPDENGPVESTTGVDAAGALLHVIPSSSHEESGTPQTSKPRWLPSTA